MVSVDVNRAFLHPPLKRSVYAKPPKELGFKGAVLMLLKVVYGLCDAPRAFFEFLFATLKSLGCSLLPSDPCVAYLPATRTCREPSIIISHVDDMLATENLRMKSILEGIQRKFESNGQKSLPYMFNGLYMTKKNESLIIHQLAYIEKNLSVSQQQITGSAEEVLKDEDMSLFRKIAGCLQWVVRNTAPMYAAAVTILQMGSKPRTYGQLRQLSKVFLTLHQLKPVLMFP